MTAAFPGWLFFRCLRWLFWLASVAYYVEVLVHRSQHINSFGHLLHGTEFWMFNLPLAAVFAGFLEMMMREKAGMTRPRFLRDWTGRA